jgi:hypothetical protein
MTRAVFAHNDVNTVVWRPANGDLQVPFNPVDDHSATSKRYVNNAIAAASDINSLLNFMSGVGDFSNPAATSSYNFPVITAHLQNPVFRHII